MPHPQRKSVNKYEKQAEPQITMDFHKAGILSNDEIIALTKRFLERCSDKGLEKVLIITGKGIHSRNGQAVVKPLVEKVLAENEHVKTFSWAARHRGGDGAFEIQLLT